MNSTMRRAWFHRWVALAFLVAHGVALPARAEAGSPQADQKQEQRVTEARQAYQRALAQFDAGEFTAALAGFRRAFELAPSFHILYNMAVVHMALEDAAASMEAFEQYLQEGAEQVPPERREEVRRELAELSRRVAWLDVRVNRADAQIWIDDRDVGTSPLARRLRLNPGMYLVRVRDRSDRLEEQIVRLQPGEERVVSFQLEGERVTESPQTPTVPVQSEPSTAQPPWLAWGVTGALAVSAGIAGFGAMRASAEERATQEKRGVTPDELRDARDAVRGWALATDIFLAATAVGAGVSLYLTLRSKDGGPDTALVVTPGSLSARYQF